MNVSPAEVAMLCRDCEMEIHKAVYDLLNSSEPDIHMMGMQIAASVWRVRKEKITSDFLNGETGNQAELLNFTGVKQ